MAQSSIAPRPTTRPVAKRKPDRQRVIQTYWYEVKKRGKRGAYKRTGDLYNLSDESVRRYVHADEERATPAPVDDPAIVYMPPPGAYPEPQPAPPIAQNGADECAQLHTLDITPPHKMPQPDDPERGKVMSSTMGESEAGSHPSTIATAGNTTCHNATRHTVERDNVSLAAAETPQPEPHPDPLPPPIPESPPDPDLDPWPFPAPDPPPWPTPEPTTPSARPLVITRVVRVPVEREPAGLVGWVRTHDAASKQLLGLVVLLVMILATWLG